MAASTKSSFDCGMIKFETGSMEIINEVVNLDVDNNNFPIRVVENFSGANTILQASCKCKLMPVSKGWGFGVEVKLI